jgi:ABC-type antimicrobial peptide transport system ATPase subunit
MQNRELTIDIKGQAGHGKSVLADALATLFRALGAEVLVEDGGRYGGNAPLPSLTNTKITINVEQK